MTDPHRHAPEFVKPEISEPEIDISGILEVVETVPDDRAAFVHIGGVSSAGKSTIAAILQRDIQDSAVLPIDAYLAERLWDPTRIYDHVAPDPSRPYIGGISPAIWDLDLLDVHLGVLRTRLPVAIPIFDETIKDRVGYEKFAAPKNLILEGGQSFSDRFIGLADYKVLVEAPFHDRLVRKIVRTHVIYRRNDIDEMILRYCTKDEPVRQHYSEEFERLADQVVNNPVDPNIAFGDFLETVAPESSGHTFNLVPKPTYGRLRSGEKFEVVNPDDSEPKLRYSVGTRRLVDLPIPRLVLNSMLAYYRIA